GGAAAGGGDRGFPFVAGSYIGKGQRRKAVGRLENSRKIFGTFHVTRQPVKIVGGAREHLNPVSTTHPSKTQVSFVPPPWLEFTTRDPSFSATRVRPPGTMRTPSRPVSTNGRKSTCRDATPFSTQVGQVDSANVGCEMKFFGEVFSFARNCSIATFPAVGPISMP